MNARQIDLIRTSFAALRPAQGAAGACFYDRLFELDPSLRPLFDDDLRAQSRKLMETLGFVVNALDRLDELVPEVMALGRRHRSYGVRDEHYETVEQALLDTLALFLAKDFTADVREAWHEAYTVISHLMQAADPEDATTSVH